MMPKGIAAAQGHASAFRTGPLSMHSQTHLDVIRRFLPIELAADDQDDGTVVVRFCPRNSGSDATRFNECTESLRAD